MLALQKDSLRKVLGQSDQAERASGSTSGGSSEDSAAEVGADAKRFRTIQSNVATDQPTKAPTVQSER